MKGRLNLFQAAMLRWRDLDPYNAVHVARIAAPFDRERLRGVISAQLETDGLTGLVLDRQRRRYEYRGGPAETELNVVSPGGNRTEAVRAEIERQLNLAFPSDGALVPFRFFAVADGDAFDLGLAYDHFVAGGDSIAALLCAIAARYTGAPRDGTPPALYPATFAGLLWRNFAYAFRGIPWLSQTAISCRRGLRPRYADESDGHNGVKFVRIDGPAFATMQSRAKAWGVTFNDLWLAALLLVLSRWMAPGAPTARRREIGVASIVNLRDACGYGVADAFGQFLTSLRLSRAVPAGATLQELAQDVHRETARIKRGRLHLQTLSAVRFNGLVWMFLSDRRRRRLYTKTFPVLSGLTTLNINALWTPSVGAPARYLRAVPTGPIAPLVVAATTCGNAVELGLSYRISADIAKNVDRIAEELRQCFDPPS